MGDEHTWCFMDPSKQPITNDILQVKFGFFQKAADMSQSLLDSALSSVYKKESPVIAVFNTLSWPHGGLVTVPGYQSKTFGRIVNEEGKPVTCQRLSSGELVFYADNIPALSSKKYFLKKGKAKTNGKLAHDNILDNEIIKATIDSISGDISSLISNGNEFVDPTANCALNSYRYLYGDNDPNTAIGAKDVKMIIKENGPVLATIEVTSEAEGCNSLSREISIITGAPYLEIANMIDKKSVLKKEGVHFGFAFNIPDPETHVDIPWGVMQLEKDQLSGANRNWITFQRWLDISNNKKGVTWCSLDAPVFESDNITANIIGAATNSPQWIKKLQPSATIYSWVMNNHWHTNFPLSQEGKVLFRYKIFPHNNGYNADMASKFGMEQSQPLIVVPVK
jgi:alpha-mannosidase